MALIEQRTLASVSHDIITDSLRVVWFDEILRDGEVISRVPHPCVYNRAHKDRFIADVGVDSTKYLTMSGW